MGGSQGVEAAGRPGFFLDFGRAGLLGINLGVPRLEKGLPSGALSGTFDVH